MAGVAVALGRGRAEGAGEEGNVALDGFEEARGVVVGSVGQGGFDEVASVVAFMATKAVRWVMQLRRRGETELLTARACHGGWSSVCLSRRPCSAR